jgi:hypothetical protein
MGGNVHQDDAAKLKATVALTAGTTAIVEVRDPTVTTRKLAVDANGKIGVSSLPNVTVGAALPEGTNILGSIKLTDGTHTADINANLQLLVKEDLSDETYSQLTQIAVFCSQTPLVTQIDKAAVDGAIISDVGLMAVYWLTITNTGVNATEFNLKTAAAGTIVFHLKINPGETLDFRWIKYITSDKAPIYYDYIAGADPALSFTIGYWVD